MWSGGGRYKDVNLLDGAIELEIFPNPASDEVIIHLLGQSTSAVLNITDQFGKNILTQPIEPGLTEIVLDLSSGRFPSGAYFVSLLSESHRLTQRLVIAK
ncbi:MAG: T9SS type A sorting domain-containing protein [Saprospiraceae bacterium]|nr:T9SS type A sorting domain-containing protein [Saprospiraceae bacterium]